MTLTTFKDLIEDAERVLTDIVIRRTLQPHPLIAAWPELHRQALYALSAAGGARPSRRYGADHLIADAPPPRMPHPRAAARNRPCASVSSFLPTRHTGERTDLQFGWRPARRRHSAGGA